MKRWVVRQRHDERYPYRLQVEDGDIVVWDVIAKEKWPTAQAVFCLRVPDEDHLGPEVESCQVLDWSVQGVKRHIRLDRPQRKRASFLVLTKDYKNKPGTYQQIFFQTSQTEQQTRAPVAATRRVEHASCDILIDDRERHAWSFDHATVRRLEVGDYALKVRGKTVAAVERKTLRNLLGDLSDLPTLQAKLKDLDVVPHRALVIEATYADLGNPKKILPFYSDFVWKKLTEIQVEHPNLPIHYVGNRKSGNTWARHFFQWVHGRYAKTELPIPESPDLYADRVEKAALNTEFFRTGDIAKSLNLRSDQVLLVVNRLKIENKVHYDGARKGWVVH